MYTTLIYLTGQHTIELCNRIKVLSDDAIFASCNTILLLRDVKLANTRLRISLQVARKIAWCDSAIRQAHTVFLLWEISWSNFHIMIFHNFSTDVAYTSHIGWY